MYFSKKDIEQTPRVRRLNLINSISGIKPANLVGTKAEDDQTNLAIISSVVHLGSDPALMGFIMRPTGEVRRHTYENIMESRQFTINHVHEDIIKRAHYTSAKFPRNVSEFEACQLNEEYINNFSAPFVQESYLKVGLAFLESISIKANDTIMIVGQVEHLIVPDEVLDERGYINLSAMRGVGISGLNSYYTLNKIQEHPYARVSEVPVFEDEKKESA